MQSSRPSTYRPDIDGLRAIAVVSVILFHLDFARFAGGFVGVDVFFVISGFLITGHILSELEKESFSFGRFYLRRARRLFPALFFTLAVSFAVGVALLSPDHLRLLSRSLLAALGSVSNVVFWKQAGYFATLSFYKPLLHTWSLGVEEQFYFVWPLTLVALWKLGRARAVLLFLVVSALVSLYFTQQWLRTDSEGAFFLAPFRVTEFAIGAACVWLLRLKAPPVWIRELCVALGLTAVAYAILTYTPNTAFPGVNALLPCVGSAAIIYGGDKSRYLRAWLGNPLAAGIGLVSYSLYLAHWPIYVFYRYWKLGPLTLPEKGVTIVASFATAVLMYHFVEKPFRVSPAKAAQLRPRSFALACVALVVVMSVPAGIASMSDGWSWRFSKQALALVGDKATFNRERTRMIRSPLCHMNGAFERQQQSLATCLKLRADQSNILVLGDSHAADLWGSLHTAYPGTNFLQATGAACVPIENRYARSLDPCGRLIRYIKHEFDGLKALDGVILSSRWPDDFASLETEVAFYRALNVPVVVFGPVVEFDPDVRTLAYRFDARDGLELFVDRHRDESSVRLDRDMKAFARRANVPYISKRETFCGEGACPLLDRRGKLMIQDYGHWGVEAAAHFGRRLRSSYSTSNSLFASP